MSFSNKIKGCLYGYAIGDALGRGTEFMTMAEANRRYPTGLHEYNQIIRDAHRSSRKQGEYTGDTQVVLHLAESIIDRQGVDYMDFSRRYKAWFDRQDSDDTDAHMRHVLQNESFLTDPHATCRETYEKQRLYEAPNEAMGRAMLIGLWPKDVEQNSTDNCRLTHWNSGCVASSVIISTVANELLWHRRMADRDLLNGIAERIDPEVRTYIDMAHEGTLADFEIDDEETSWYVRKNLGIALWSLWHHTDPAEALYDVLSYGGDANANGALTMGLLGLKYGFSRLPESLVDNLLGAERVADVADRLTDTLQHADTGEDTDD